MDTHAFASLAHVRVLLVPVGTISKAKFETYAAEFRTFESIRLGDIPADTKDHRARFMPNPLSAGHLHLTFPSHPPPSNHFPLALLRPSHFPLAVIGIAACASTDSLGSLLAQFNASLVELFPSGSIFPLAKNCFVFEESDGSTNLNLDDSLPGLVVIPNMMGNKKLYIGTLLADLCSHILGEFGNLVQSLETPVGNEYLNSSLFPTFPPISELSNSFELSQKCVSTPPLQSHNSQPEISKGNSSIPTPAPLKRNVSSGPTFLQSTLSAQQPQKKRLSTMGATSSHARLYKLLADLFLLSGRTEDAMLWYTEALVLFRSSTDCTWHAATLEGMATVTIIDAWAAGHGLQNSAGNNSEPWADVAEKLSQAITLYSRLPALDGERQLSLVAYLYCCSILRHSSLMFSIWSAKGWGPLAFTIMLQPGSSPYLPPTISSEDDNSIILDRLSSISGISRTSISAMLTQVHGPWLLHLGPSERIAILEATASLYGCLGYKRKEAYILREVLGCIMDLIVCGREEDGPGKSGGLHQGTPQGMMGIRANESSDGNESILRLLKYACKVLGINLEAVGLYDKEPDQPPQRRNDPADQEQPFGWPELQVGVIREAVAVAEALPDYVAAAQFALSALKTLQSILTPGDQFHLQSTSARALATAQRRGENKLVDYWSGMPVVSIEIAPLPLTRLPIETPVSALKPKAMSDVAPILTGATDPFLYNPRRSSITQGKTLVVQNEQVEFLIVLQNPYIFDVEIQELSLSTSGVPLVTKPTRVVIPANSTHEVILSAMASETGSITVRGCTARAPGSITCEFLLPIATDEEEEQYSRRKSAVSCEMGRSKYQGLDSFPWIRETKRNSVQSKTLANMKPPRFLECKVVPEQPLLRIRRTSVTHGALMLYDGEVHTIRMTLENVSSLPVDFLRLAFDDSTIAPAQLALSEGELSIFETYETEYDLIHRPVFSWDKDQARDIEPGQKVTLTITCHGKVGCTSGTIHVSYSYTQRPQQLLGAPPEVFHIRQLSWPLTVTVYQMLECFSMDILPFPAHAQRKTWDGQQRVGLRRDNLQTDDQSSWCLFSIEVRNSYGSPFEIMFERCQEGAPHATTSATIPPGSMSRILLPIKKFLLSEEQLKEPIPTLSDRQFVVAKDKLSEAEAHAQRTLFWYREELFKHVRGTWKEAGGARSGTLSLRSQRITMPMVETLRMEAAQVRMTLKAYPNNQDVAHEGEKYILEPNELVYLNIEVSNMSQSVIVLTLDLTIEPVEHVVHEGVLNGLPVGRLEPGSRVVREVPVCFLARGQFEVIAEVNPLGISRGGSVRSGFGHLTALVREG
ncbi:hypothetical protein AX16_003664 [Volvariella volvacea WC 439]|nr:hypothetical protein AX16_003664 [Volvariella volvacea WC 439]